MFGDGFDHIANPPAIVQRRLSEEEIRQEVREECAQYLESLKQFNIPEIFRNCDFYQGREHPDGWVDFSSDEKKLLAAAAKGIREGRKADGRRDQSGSTSEVSGSGQEPTLDQ